MNSFLSFLEVIAVVAAFIVIVWLIADIIMMMKRKINQKKKQVLEEYKLTDERVESISEQVISKYVSNYEMKKIREAVMKGETKKELEKHSLLNRIIVMAWQKKEKKNMWSPVRITGKNECEEISIEVRGERGDAFPCEAIISLENIPGLGSYVYKQLVEFRGEDKRKIERWITINAPTE